MSGTVRRSLFYALAMATPLHSGAIGQEPSLTTVRVASGLESPVFVTHAPNDYERVFIVEVAGTIRILKDGVVLPEPFLDIRSIVAHGGELGLLGMAFHPNYTENGFLYVNYTAGVPGEDLATVVARYDVSDDHDIVDGLSGKTVLSFPQPGTLHNGGWIAFGPKDGYLYVATGDGGLMGFSQIISNNLLGKILRIDVNIDDWPDDDERNYAIPPTNPFVDRVGDDEIWAYGLRNPWRCSFDTVTGDLYIADVGVSNREEINFQPDKSSGGENYGWPCLEGSECCFACLDDPSFQRPIFEYSHDVTKRCAIIGGEVYRGSAISGLGGAYFFADWCTSEVWTMTDPLDSVTVVERTTELCPGLGLGLEVITSFGRDASGEIYVCANNSELYKIVPGPGSATPEIIGSFPPNGSIDARQTSGIDGGNETRRRSSLTVTMTECAYAMSPPNFVVAESNPDAPAPVIERVRRSGQNETGVTLDRAISEDTWTTIEHINSGTFVRLGVLPGDVNGDATSNESDVRDLLEALVGSGQPRRLWSIDIDVSGALAPPDILRLIDLLNGAGVYPPYFGRSLPSE